MQPRYGRAVVVPAIESGPVAGEMRGGSLGGVQEGREAGHVRAHIVSPFPDLRAEGIHEGLGLPAAMEGGCLRLHGLLPWSRVPVSLGCRCAKTGTSSVYLGDPR